MEEVKHGDIRRVGLFILISYSFSIFWGILIFISGRWFKFYGIPRFVISLLYMFSPLFSLLIMGEKPRQMGLRFRINRWYLMAYLLPLFISLLTVVLSFILPGLKFDPSAGTILDRFKDILTPEQIEKAKESMSKLPVHVFFVSMVQGLLYGAFVNTLPALGEEIGWRGFLYRELKYLGFVKMSLIIGLIWGVWHAPIVLQGHNYPHHPYIGVFMMVLFCLLLTPILIFIREKTESVLGAALFHGGINAFAGLPYLVVRGDELLVGILGLYGFLLLFIIDVFIILMRRRDA